MPAKESKQKVSRKAPAVAKQSAPTPYSPQKKKTPQNIFYAKIPKVEGDETWTQEEWDTWFAGPCDTVGVKDESATGSVRFLCYLPLTAGRVSREGVLFFAAGSDGGHFPESLYAAPSIAEGGRGNPPTPSTACDR
jgi:hypothetical protein